MQGKIVLLFVLLYTALIQDAKAARLRITPSQNLEAGAKSLTVRCSPVSDSVYTTLYSINIYKQVIIYNRRSQTYIDLGGDINGVFVEASKYTVTGNYNITQPPTESYLQVIITNPTCNETGLYECRTNGESTTTGKAESLTDAKSVTVQSAPVSVDMIRSEENIRYAVGETIEITCQGDVGNPERYWSWESKSASDSLFHQIRENITTRRVDPPTTTACGYYSRSILSYYVGQDDNGLVIRCNVGNSLLYSANKTIYLTDVRPEVGSAQLDITPSQNIQSGATSLTVKCSPGSDSGYTVLYSITIGKRYLGLNTSIPSLLASIDFEGTNIGPGLSVPKYIISGYYEELQPNQSYLQAVIKHLDCNDAAEYQCTTHGAVGSTVKSLEMDKKVTLQITGTPTESGYSISPIVSGVIGFICGIMVMVIVGVLYYFYKNRRQPSKTQDVSIPDYLTARASQCTTIYATAVSSASSNTNYLEYENQSPATNQPTTTTVSDGNVRNVECENQSVDEQNRRNEYETLDHASDNTYLTLQ